MRLLLALLLLANGLFFGWSQGWLDGVAGVRAGGDREPERLAQQVRPDAIRVLGAQAAAAAASSAAAAASAAATPPASAAVAAPALQAASQAASAAAPASASVVAASAPAPAAANAALACLEAGPFSAAELTAAEAALKVAAVPAARWVDVKTFRGGAWIIYMGRYANRDAQAKKEEELSRIKVGFEPVTEPANLAPGLSLGRFEARPAADAALAQFARRGIRTARVVELTPPVVTHRLRVDRADARLAETLKGLPSTALGRGFSACRPG